MSDILLTCWFLHPSWPQTANCTQHWHCWGRIQMLLGGACAHPKLDGSNDMGLGPSRRLKSVIGRSTWRQYGARAPMQA